jgi:hypothetical protein
MYSLFRVCTMYILKRYCIYFKYNQSRKLLRIVEYSYSHNFNLLMYKNFYVVIKKIFTYTRTCTLYIVQHTTEHLDLFFNNKPASYSF